MNEPQPPTTGEQYLARIAHQLEVLTELAMTLVENQLKAGQSVEERLSKAMATVMDHPELSDRQIALARGLNPSQLSRDGTYQLVSKLARLPVEMQQAFYTGEINLDD